MSNKTQNAAPGVLPAMPAGITASWLEQTLARKFSIADLAIAKVVVTQIAEGTGMMSELARVQVTYSQEQGHLPDTFIAKYPSQNETNREVAMGFNLYEREVRYFAELDPQTSAHTPEIFLSELDGDNFIILMQDLRDYRVGDQVVGAKYAETSTAVDELAKLHATFWDGVDHLDWVPHISNSYHADNMFNFTEHAWQTMLSVFGDFVPAAIADQGQAFHRALRDLQAIMDTGPVTLIHGDFRMENLMYATQPEHDPVAILDWQGPLLGKGLVDVALLLGQSTQTDVRREKEQALLQQYVDGLVSQGVDHYDITTAWQDYKLCLLYNWCYVAVVSGTLDASNELAFSWMSQMIARQVAATQDLDLFSLLPE